MSQKNTLAALEAENARLIALLEQHGIEWRQPDPAATAPRRLEPSRLSTAEKVALFRRLFRGGAMFTLSVGKAKPLANQATLRPVPTNGVPGFAKNLESSVLTAITAG